MKNRKAISNKKIGVIILLAAVSKAYGVGDTVWVWYHNSYTLESAPQSRIVEEVNVDSSLNAATVSFTNGQSVVDGEPPRVFTTQALCAKAIVDAAIIRYDATVNLDTGTTSGASTAALPALGLVRSSS